ncbi:MAG: DUF4160 domain-containing protein [Coprobacillus sp.]|nr:DUF4160 domain-containing protein [Coprobacillus sp.]
MHFIDDEHDPPHVHAFFGGYECCVSINESRHLEGKFPRSKLKLVQSWVTIHKEELQEIWDSQDFKKIEPLS